MNRQVNSTSKSAPAFSLSSRQTNQVKGDTCFPCREDTFTEQSKCVSLRLSPADNSERLTGMRPPPGRTLAGRSWPQAQHDHRDGQLAAYLQPWHCQHATLDLDFQQAPPSLSMLSSTSWLLSSFLLAS